MPQLLKIQVALCIECYDKYLAVREKEFPSYGVELAFDIDIDEECFICLRGRKQ